MYALSTYVFAQILHGGTFEHWLAAELICYECRLSKYVLLDKEIEKKKRQKAKTEQHFQARKFTKTK